jgi:hypothetical protein
LNSGPTPWATPPPFFCEGIFWDRILQTCNPLDFCLLSS